MKKNLVILMMAMVAMFFAGCEKEFNFQPQENGEIIDSTNTVQLFYSVDNGTKESKGEISTGGGTIIADSGIYISFWLEPATGSNMAKGIYEIVDSSSLNFIYQSSVAENGIDIRPDVGKYGLKVYNISPGTPSFFDNITIIVNGTTPPPPPTQTSPVRLYNLNVSGGNASVNVAISKSQWQAQATANWFYLRRVNGLNFVGNQAVTSTTDSVFFQLNFSAVDQTYVEFNAGYHDGSVGGVWLMPGYGNPPSILAGGINTPYGGSENFFGFRLHSTTNGNWELRTHNGTLVLSTGTPTPNPIPGNNGDGLTNNYQVRWSGYYHYFKTSLASPTFRYRLGTTGAWVFITPSQLANNPDYWEIHFPSGTTGEINFQWGAGSITTFAPSSTEMQNSMYWDIGLGCLRKVL